MPQRHRRHRVAQRLALDQPALLEPADRIGERHIGAGDRGGARAAVGLEHVAIERDLVLAQRLHVDHGAERAADQPLDFLRPARLLARGRLAARAGVGRARQHAVFGGHPAVARHLRAPPRGERRLDRGGARALWSMPKVTRHEPSAFWATLRSMVTARIWSGARPEGRIDGTRQRTLTAS